MINEDEISSRCRTLAWVEVIFTLVLSAIVVVLLVRHLFLAGPLWRDEISSLTLAKTASFQDFHTALALDPFPALYFLLLRGWCAVGLGGNDFELRVLGFLIAIGIVGAVWCVCRRLSRSAPLCPILLCGFNPWFLTTIDSLRPYGLGILCLIFLFAATWRLVERPASAGGFVAVTLAALLAVQTLYTNAVLFLCFALVGITSLLLRKKWRGAGLIVLAGALAAISLLLYLPIYPSARSWLTLLPGPQSFGEVLDLFRVALTADNPVVAAAWLLIAVAGIAAMLMPKLRQRLRGDHGRMWLAVLIPIFAAAILVTIYRFSVWTIHPRYFLPWLVIATLCWQTFFAKLAGGRFVVHLVGVALAVVIALAWLPRAWRESGARLTNVDQIAGVLVERGQPDDLIVLTSFFYGVSFQRYYDGMTPWVTIPDVEPSGLHRWDKVKAAMSGEDPMFLVRRRIALTLEQGHTVFLVGRLPAAPAAEPVPLPPAQDPGGQLGAYSQNWQEQVAWLIEHGAVNGSDVPIDRRQPVSTYEDLGVFAVSGWRGADQ